MCGGEHLIEGFTDVFQVAVAGQVSAKKEP